MDGQTLREHLEGAYERSGVMPERLASAPALPDGCAALWSDFLAMHGCRGVGMSGPQRITFSDIDAYQRVTRTRLEPWEITAIRGADSAFMAFAATQRKEAK